MNLKTYLLLPLALTLSLQAHGSELQAQIRRGILSSGSSQDTDLIKSFANNQKELCRGFSAVAFQKQPLLKEICQIPALVQIYYNALESLSDSSQSGLELSQIRDSDLSFEIPALQGGAWVALPFVANDGLETATRILASRIAIEKALSLHAQYIEQVNPSYFSTYASFAIPRLISLFSGYSTAAKSLTYIESFSCGSAKAHKTPACQESRDYINGLQHSVMKSIGTDDILSRLANINSQNSARISLKTHLVSEAVQAVQALRSLSVQELLTSINGAQIHPEFKAVHVALTNLVATPVSIDQEDHHKMLIAVVILAEIKNLQQKIPNLSAAPATVPTDLDQKIAEQMYQLKSWVTKALTEEEEVQ